MKSIPIAWNVLPWVNEPGINLIVMQNEAYAQVGLCVEWCYPQADYYAGW